VAVAEEIAAGVADVGDDGRVEAQGAGDEGGSHAAATGVTGVAGLVDGVVGVLHQAREERGVHDALGNLAEAGEHGVDREARGDLAVFVAAHAVGEDEEPAVAVDLGGRRGNDLAEGVFVPFTGAAAVGELGKFEFEHRRTR
jgi:hypothetical protein